MTDEDQDGGGEGDFEIDLEGAIDDEARKAMQQKLRELIPIVQVLQADGALEAATTILTLLDAGGVIERRTLLPLLATFDQRMAIAFAAAGEEPGPHQESMREATASANEEAAWKQRLLDKDGNEPS